MVCSDWKISVTSVPITISQRAALPKKHYNGRRGAGPGGGGKNRKKKRPRGKTPRWLGAIRLVAKTKAVCRCQTSGKQGGLFENAEAGCEPKVMGGWIAVVPMWHGRRGGGRVFFAHRVIEGAEIISFCQDLGTSVQTPLLLMVTGEISHFIPAKKTPPPRPFAVVSGTDRDGKPGQVGDRSSTAKKRPGEGSGGGGAGGGGHNNLTRARAALVGHHMGGDGNPVGGKTCGRLLRRLFSPPPPPQAREQM